MTTFAKVRDWKEGETIPMNNGYLEMKEDEIVECEQPGELDGAEFNLVLKFKLFEVRGRSIDFDFLYEKTLPSKLITTKEGL